MTNILIFANPFGYGPSGKAISIAKYISEHTNNSKVILCGNQYLSRIMDKDLKYLKVDERNENEIATLLEKTNGRKLVISSQNRFAIKAALNQKVPSAFLDGLAWFWRTIPDDHFLADIIFWLNYPGIIDKIPQEFSKKIHLISGISDSDIDSSNKKTKNTIFYIGGCNNPLTPLPTKYLDLIGNLLTRVLEKNRSFLISTDINSTKYLEKYPSIYKNIKCYSHARFLQKISESEKFIGNGGQTATLEAANLGSDIYFFLPINLSQLALIEKLNESNQYLALNWNNYIEIPDNIQDFNEKDAINSLNTAAGRLILDKKNLSRLESDFLRLISRKPNIKTNHAFLNNLGFSGSEDIFKILEKEWNI